MSTVPTIIAGAAPSANFFRDVIYQQSQANASGGAAPKAPWDIRRPQPELARVSRLFSGKVLDVGCGLGDNARWIATLPGVESVAAMDFAPLAIAEARVRGTGEGPATLTFTEGDVFAPSSFGAAAESFDVLLDSAVFHCIGDDEAQARYLASVTPLVKKGGRAVMLVFSDMNEEATWRGPRRIGADYARQAWTAAGWRVDTLETDARYHDAMQPPRCGGLGGHALLMTATRL
jgi:SAM-dependent methyltransferase